MKINSREEAMNLVGKTIRFTKNVNKSDISQDEGMMAVITHITYNMYEDTVPENMCHQFFINQTPFEEENKKYESRDYSNFLGVPCLTAREAGLYQAEDKIYLSNDLPFEVVETDDIHITISLEEAKKIVERLEYDASWDKVGSVYYRLKKLISIIKEI